MKGKRLKDEFYKGYDINFVRDAFGKVFVSIDGIKIMSLVSDNKSIAYEKAKKKINAHEKTKNERMKKVNYIPKGFRKIKNITSPPGYTWYNNGKSRFKPGYESVLVKNKIKWVLNGVVSDYMDAKNSADDLKDMAEETKIVETSNGDYAVYWR